MVIYMDTESLEMLHKILDKNPEELTTEEIGFLNARSIYLTHEQRRVFAGVLEEKNQNLPHEPISSTMPPEDHQPTQYSEPTNPQNLPSEELTTEPNSLVNASEQPNGDSDGSGDALIPNGDNQGAVNQSGDSAAPDAPYGATDNKDPDKAPVEQPLG